MVQNYKPLILKIDSNGLKVDSIANDTKQKTHHYCDRFFNSSVPTKKFVCSI